MADSVLYLVNLAEGEKPPRTQADIARAAGATEVTVMNRSKMLRKKFGINLGPILCLFSSKSNSLKTR